MTKKIVQQPPDPRIQSFVSSGFTVSSGDIPKRILIGSQGQERTGKTDWALRTLPGPIIYVGLDQGHEGVIEKYEKKKIIAKSILNIPPVGSQQHYLQHWLKVNTSVQSAMLHPDVRSVILDTGTNIWELLRLAEFGQFNPTGDIKKLYPSINQAYRSLIRMAYDREINLCVIHTEKKLYQTRTVTVSGKGPQSQEYWDGVSYERAGFGEGGYLIQVQIQHLFDPSRGATLNDKFGIKILDCRQNMEIAGMTLWGSDADFPSLASYVFPDTTPNEWGADDN